MVSFQELLKATDGFASANLIGEGCFGRVYRGILDQNQQRNVIAVKVMNLLEQVGSKSFLKECKTLRNVRRRNLVKRISACSGIDFQGNPFKALIYEFMPNRSLEGWLHAPKEANAIEPGEPKILNFPQRLNIAIDVASALDYLHHHCEETLDWPEYGIGTEATTSGDMYSFGILLLEMFTGKRPTDDMFKDDLTLHHSTKMALSDQVLEVVDPLLLAGDNEEENANCGRNPRRTRMQETRKIECLISILGVGIACSVESPKGQMDSVDAATQLRSIGDKFLGTRIRTHREARV
ncbi:probable LRR receptor-like serine/threonine-protein kinase At3g47570 isoform X4 [Durio zibethinus]|uniref:Probable LRR receptor-like serine/threonine-protein kinase At3g47570 isoform X4 n=1 Tax=Durio zibethinus TaxID=66656 RepID=A0A6P5XW20_DURZI|nr:probable LRR receptor-like serine/threonine-protein kinase At3g47570 isoform X4 [Durio zibethinus]